MCREKFYPAKILFSTQEDGLPVTNNILVTFSEKISHMSLVLLTLRIDDKKKMRNCEKNVFVMEIIASQSSRYEISKK